jgi:hypothetical protein
LNMLRTIAILGALRSRFLPFPARLAVCGLGAACALVGISCGDPVRSSDVAALGGEAPNVSPGAFHRPGQPCLTCHGGDGPSSKQWSVAGTVFKTLGGTTGAQDVTVELTDAAGKVFKLTSNGVGNFYVPIAQFAPKYPLKAKVYTAATGQEMITQINGSGSCATCHKGAGGPGSVPAIYLSK